MDSLVLFETAIILFSSALHLIAYPKKHLLVDPMYTLDVAVDGMAVFALGELQDLPCRLIETKGAEDFGLKPGKDDGSCWLMAGVLAGIALFISWQDGALDQNLPLHLSLHAMAHMSCHMWL